MFDFRRTDTCGSLTIKDVGKEITLSGWVHRRRDHGGLIFIDLRDRYGLTQLIFDPNMNASAHKIASQLRSEWVISVNGIVSPRGEGMANPHLKTGEIEIQVSALDILSEAKTPPFSICDEQIDVREETRLKYRYLDMRRGKIINNLRMRHKALLEIRKVLDEEGFTEVTTPILSKSTPEGARDYLVPSRTHPGNFFALPQSPQIFKQLLMIGGLDKYFQIATCFRDEDLRADRQPEFTQIDLEMSFQTQEEIFRVGEHLMKRLFQSCLDREILTPFPRMSYQDCLEHYGSDKPDLRFGMPLIRLDDIVKKSEFSLFTSLLEQGGCVKALCVKGGAKKSRREVDQYAEFVKSFGLDGLIAIKDTEEGLTSSVTKFFTPELLKELQVRMHSEPGDLILIAGAMQSRVNQGLDHLRREIGKQDKLIRTHELNFLWVIHFPLFSRDEKTHEIQSEHHPFTAPHPDDVHLLQSDPTKVRALAYDLVLNGYEMSSGSQRIHNQKVQAEIFRLLKLTKEEMQNKFGYFLEALQYGVPPHIGMALGVERLSMILSETDNIRDVVAFPKTQKASDLMMQTPSFVTQEQLKELNIETKNGQEILWN